VNSPATRVPRKCPILALAVLAGAGSIQAAEHLVSSPEAFDAALARIQPGDALVLRDGVWRDAKLHFRARGNPEEPVTLRTETPGGAVFEGASQLIVDGAHLVVTGLNFRNNSDLPEIVTPYDVTVASVVIFKAGTSHSRLTETAIVDSGPGVSTYVHLEPGSRSNRVDHCFFSNQGAIGMTFYVEVDPTTPNHHQIDHSYFGDRKPGRGNRWETLRIGHSEQQEFESATTVAHNYFFRCNGEIECISNKSTGNQFLYNAFVENRGQLTLRHGDRAWIEGNYFDGGEEPASQGIRVSGSGHVILNNYFKGIRDALLIYNGQPDPEPRGYTAVNDALIAFNTLEDCANNLVLGIGSRGRTLTPRNLRITGNLVQAQPGPPIIRLRSDDIDVSYDANVMFGGELGIPEPDGIHTGLSVLERDAWDRILPGKTGSSPPIDPETVARVSRDLNGRPRGEATTIGAIHGRGAPPLYPLSREDVGPRWMD
jgi:poly(beta-D-mannuronate) lyase